MTHKNNQRKSAFISLSLLAIVALALCGGCSDSDDAPYPQCETARIVYDPATGQRLSGPPEVELPEIPEHSPDDLPQTRARVAIKDGLWRMDQELEDVGSPEPDAPIRLLISLPTQHRAELEDWLERAYDPASPDYLKFFSPSCFIAQHAPPPESIATVRAWLSSFGLVVDRIATNRLLLQASGTVAQAEAAFAFRMHRIIRVQRKDFAALAPVTVPKWLSPHIEGLLGVQDAPTNTERRVDDNEPKNDPIDTGVTPDQLAQVYGIESLRQAGMLGQGQTIAIPVGWDARRSDIKTYFDSMGITRSGEIEWIYTDLPPALFSGETTVDVQMAGAMAPGADIAVYLGYDNTDISLTWAINEAVGEGRASAITYSYSHQEVITAWELQEYQSHAGRMAAALGITFLAAAGDSRNVDNPANSPWVTAVGATYLVVDENLDRVSELDTTFGGMGRSALFAKPDWQREIDPEGLRRAIVDLSLHCSPFPNEHALWAYIYGEWGPSGGTSLASPLMAGMIVIFNQSRGEKGRVGWLNRTIYTHPGMQDAFFDVTEGLNDSLNESLPGWDFSTGWGSPRMNLWLERFP